MATEEAPPPPPAWLVERFPNKNAWLSLRSCRLRVDAEEGAGLELSEAGELGYLIDSVEDRPGQDPALRFGAALLAVAGESLLGLPEGGAEAAFRRAFGDGAELLVVDADELREALVERDSNEECPCEEPPDGDFERVVPAEESANYELLRRAKSSTEYEAVVHIPVGRGTVWILGPEAMVDLTADLARLSENFGVGAEAKLNRAGNVECVVLSGVSGAIATARSEVIQILNFYRDGKWQACGDVAHIGNPDGREAPESANSMPAGGGVDMADGSIGFSVPEHVADLRQFKYHDHTADIIVHSWGTTRSEAFAQVVAGMFNYMTELDSVELRSAVEVEATGHDLLDLLYHLLDEFLFIFGTEMHVSRRIEIIEFDEEHLKIKARGYGEKMNLKKHEQGTEIKAITMHMMRILTPDIVMTEEGTQPRVAAGEDDSKPLPGFPHEVYVLLDI